MKLKPRLAEVAKCIMPESVVVDIGTDHAYLPVYLIKEGICRKVIGVEKYRKNLQKARETVDLFNLSSKIELRSGDGFYVIREEDCADVAVIAGMGGRTISSILLSGAEKAARLKYFILQPMGDTYLLRRWLIAHRFCITDERLAWEKKRFYEIIIAQHGKQAETDSFLLEVGPGLIERRDPLLVPYLEDKIKRCRRIITALNQAKEAGSLKKRNYYLCKESRLKEVLSHVVTGSGFNGYDG